MVGIGKIALCFLGNKIFWMAQMFIWFFCEVCEFGVVNLEDLELKFPWFL